MEGWEQTLSGTLGHVRTPEACSSRRPAHAPERLRARRHALLTALEQQGRCAHASCRHARQQLWGCVCAAHALDWRLWRGKRASGRLPRRRALPRLLLLLPQESALQWTRRRRVGRRCRPPLARAASAGRHWRAARCGGAACRGGRAERCQGRAATTVTLQLARQQGSALGRPALVGALLRQASSLLVLRVRTGGALSPAGCGQLLLLLRHIAQPGSHWRARERRRGATHAVCPSHKPRCRFRSSGWVVCPASRAAQHIQPVPAVLASLRQVGRYTAYCTCGFGLRTPRLLNPAGGAPLPTPRPRPPVLAAARSVWGWGVAGGRAMGTRAARRYGLRRPAPPPVPLVARARRCRLPAQQPSAHLRTWSRCPAAPAPSEQGEGDQHASLAREQGHCATRSLAPPHHTVIRQRGCLCTRLSACLQRWRGRNRIAGQAADG